MKIAVLTKQNSDLLVVKERILDALKAEGSFDILDCKASTEISDDCEKVLVFGGDGTMLEAINKSAELEIPILGINLGTVGFLAEFEQNVETGAIIKAIKSLKYDKRMLLNACVDKNQKLALNDIVLKSPSTRPINIDLLINDCYVDSYHGDGIIVSTPTGSTAYSLSAGGPVIYPYVDALVINPVCPHSLHSRPLVISSNSKIELKLRDEQDASVVVDGNIFANIKQNESVTISKSDKYARFVYTNKDNFYKKLLNKMNRWGTTSLL